MAERVSTSRLGALFVAITGPKVRARVPAGICCAMLGAVAIPAAAITFNSVGPFPSGGASPNSVAVGDVD